MLGPMFWSNPLVLYKINNAGWAKILKLIVMYTKIKFTWNGALHIGVIKSSSYFPTLKCNRTVVDVNKLGDIDVENFEMSLYISELKLGQHGPLKIISLT